MTKEYPNPNEKTRDDPNDSLVGLRTLSFIRHSSFVIRHFHRYFREWSVAICFLALLLLLALLAPGFFKKSQLMSIATAAAPVLLVACGVSLVIISRQIDISLGSQFALSSVLLGLLVQAHWPMPLAALAAVAFGACCGAFNGLCIVGLGLPSIVVTLATLLP